MVRIAHERIADLFALAAREAGDPASRLADRYVTLARKVGTRYNVRLLPEYRELYCRSCSTYWVEGRTVRTRLHDGRRVRTCLACGRARRLSLRPPPDSTTPPGWTGRSPVPREESATVSVVPDEVRPGRRSEDG